ncbi:MAG: hypothetical protein AAFX05_07555 [Planctomycetota bacterium]
MQTNPNGIRTRCRRGAALGKVVFALVVIGALGGSGWFLIRGGDAATDSDVELYDVNRSEFDIKLTANGDLRARRETVLRSELESRATIVEVVEEGTFVNEGDVLVRLSSEEIENELEDDLLQLESARSDLVAARSELEIQLSNNESEYNKAQLRLELALLEMKKWEQGDDPEKMRQLALDLDSAKRESQRLTERFERSQNLYAEEFLSSDELKQDELSMIRAQSDLEKSKLRLQVYETYEREKQIKQLGSEIDEARAELDRVQRRNESRLATKQANVTNRERQLARRDTRVKDLREQLANTTIVAPTSGMVVYATSLERNRWRRENSPMQIGTQINPNEELIVLPDNGEMVAAIKIHESLVGQVEEGQPARVRIDAARGRIFNGVVDSVGVIAESGGWRDPNLREYEVNVKLDLGTQDHGLKPSMRCEADLIIDHVNDAIAVPVQSIFFDGRKAYVYKPAQGKYRRHAVSVGRRSTTFAEVVNGLDVGDRILTRQPSPAEVLDIEAADSAVADAPDEIRESAKSAATTASRGTAG